MTDDKRSIELSKKIEELEEKLIKSEKKLKAPDSSQIFVRKVLSVLLFIAVSIAYIIVFSPLSFLPILILTIPLALKLDMKVEPLFVAGFILLIMGIIHTILSYFLFKTGVAGLLLSIIPVIGVVIYFLWLEKNK